MFSCCAARSGGAIGVAWSALARPRFESFSVKSLHATAATRMHGHLEREHAGMWTPFLCQQYVCEVLGPADVLAARVLD